MQVKGVQRGFTASEFVNNGRSDLGSYFDFVSEKQKEKEGTSETNKEEICQVIS